MSLYIGCLDSDRQLRWAIFGGTIFFTSDLGPFFIPCATTEEDGEKVTVWFPGAMELGLKRGGPVRPHVVSCTTMSSTRLPKVVPPHSYTVSEAVTECWN